MMSDGVSLCLRSNLESNEPSYFFPIVLMLFESYELGVCYYTNLILAYFSGVSLGMCFHLNLVAL